MNGSKLEPKYYKSSRIKEQFRNAHEESLNAKYPDYDHKYKKQKEDFNKTKKAIWTEVDQLFEETLWNS